MFPPLPRSLIRRVIYPVYRTLRHDGVTEIFNQLDKDQWLSREKIQEIRWTRLQTLLNQVTISVPYYRDLFRKMGLLAADIRTPADLLNVPLLTKQAIRAAGQAMISEDRSRKGCLTSTSGSTGEPLFFYTDLGGRPMKLAEGVLSNKWVGADIGDRIAHIWAPPHDLSRLQHAAYRIREYFSNSTTVSSFEMSEKRMERYAEVFSRFKPDVLVGYPSALSRFAEFCKLRSIGSIRPRSAVCSGEKMYPHQRQVIEEAFGCPVFDRYGSNEFSLTALECDEHNGLHLLNDFLYAEVVDEDCRPTKSDEVGELVVTDLTNYYMPFIRYRTGDLAVPTTRGCACGRGSPLLERIEGRTFDMILTSDGRAVGGFFWTHLSRQVPGIRQFQVEQRERSGAIFRIVRGPEWKDEYRQGIERQIKARLGESFAVVFEMVDNIPTSRTGKFNFILSRIGEQDRGLYSSRHNCEGG